MCFYINNIKKKTLQIQTANSYKKFPLIWWRSSKKRKLVKQKKNKLFVRSANGLFVLQMKNDLFTETKNFPEITLKLSVLAV